jgi:hypothetical protein
MDSLTPSDFAATNGFVIAILAVLFLSFGTVATLVLCMRRNAANRDKEVDALLDELANEEKQKTSPPHQPDPTHPTKPLEPWERNPDWWK